jgi:uncharacterized membrane protein YvlD (DUF360 family)
MKTADLLTAGGAAIVVSIIVQVTKRWIPADVIPLYALAWGVFLVELGTVAVALASGTLDPLLLVDGFLTGILAGASAIGIYDVQRPAGMLGPKE